MLYQTLPISFQLNPCSSFSPSTPLLFPQNNHFLSSSSFSNSQQMDCVETKALKTSFSEMFALKTTTTTQQIFNEDLWCGNGANGVAGDDLFVEGLLNFSNEDVQEKEKDFVVEDDDEEEEGYSSVSSQEHDLKTCSDGLSIKNEFGSVPESELTVPADDVANLEWLSHFVEDSFSEFSLQHLVGKTELNPQTKNDKGSEMFIETPGLGPVGVATSVPAKARSKRSRTGGRVWSLGSLPLTDSSSSSSSSSPSSSSSSSCLIFNNTGQNLDMFSFMGKPPAKKQKKKPMPEAQQRRCSHCGVNKTPQWRTGPLGAKTLCNACGVRYKSGRLLPEYRPAISPTFSSDVHSNNHRKVLEMRRKKEEVVAFLWVKSLRRAQEIRAARARNGGVIPILTNTQILNLVNEEIIPYAGNSLEGNAAQGNQGQGIAELIVADHLNAPIQMIPGVGQNNMIIWHAGMSFEASGPPQLAHGDANMTDGTIVINDTTEINESTAVNDLAHEDNSGGDLRQSLKKVF
ncbi:hypothetical protein IFM89_014776 [Coptis chinensis]|uniref:GATA-type domain-containing protein n=1 Tax=Coptis chinensis TaxID=261450 RepID=A0A835INZ5_9MAGN|nr:hypothetical protein IFM89_014776 [Coptis chinensis]